MRYAVCFAFAMLAAPVAVAQDKISPEQFLDQATGHTLTFRQFRGDTLVGVEQFLRRDLSVWSTKTGRCTYGKIEVRGPMICFIYEDFPDPENCWLPFVRNGDLVLMTRSGDIQRVSKITEQPIRCEGAPLS